MMWSFVRLKKGWDKNSHTWMMCQTMLSKAPSAAGSSATLAATSEGEGGDVATGSTSSAANGGCFPSFWNAADFKAWLNGTLIGLPLSSSHLQPAQKLLQNPHFSPIWHETATVGGA